MFIFSINLLLLLINQYYQSTSLSCKISVPTGVTSQKLDNIICIGNAGFTNPNFATFRNGSLIIETSEDAGSDIRAFYGITKEGKPYFENEQYFLSFKADNGKYRKEAENFVIIINDNENTEYLMSVGYKTNVEIYDLKKKSYK